MHRKNYDARFVVYFAFDVSSLVCQGTSDQLWRGQIMSKNCPVQGADRTYLLAIAKIYNTTETDDLLPQDDVS